MHVVGMSFGGLTAPALGSAAPYRGIFPAIARIQGPEGNRRELVV